MTKRRRPENPENLSDEALLEKLKEDNNAREFKLAERTMGRIAPGPGLDIKKLLTYCQFILMDLGILVTAEMEFECDRAEQLDKAEAHAGKVEEQARASGLHVLGQAGPKIVKP